MKKITCIFLIVIIGGYTACRWDYHLSMYNFNEICKGNEKVGLFIYENVDLGSEYLTDISEKEALTEVDPRLLVESNKIINIERFSEDFIYEKYKYIPYSSIGPIGFLQSYVIRRSDGKVLGEAVSATNGRGWFARRGGVNFGGGGIKCPQGADRKTKFSYYRRDHELLIRNIFSSKLKGVD